MIASPLYIFILQLAGLEGWVVALDGMQLPTPLPVTKELLLALGQRIDLFVDVTADVGESAHLLRIDDENGVSQAAFPVATLGARARRGLPAPLPANPDQDVLPG